jgi:uncharacterized protein (TIGR03086 family)
VSTARDRYLRALDRVDGVVADVRPDRWGLPTPCPSWDVRALLGHLVDGQRQVTAMLRGTPPPAPTTGPADLARLAGPDPAATWRQARQEAAAALAAVPDDAIVASPMGELPVAVLLGTAVVEPLLHGWDLATAVGVAADLDPETAEVTLAGVRALGPQLAATGMYAAALPVHDGTTAAEQLLALTGRRAGD